MLLQVEETAGNAAHSAGTIVFQTPTSLFVSTSLWMWRVKRSTWWTAAWPTTSLIPSFCGRSAASTSSSLLTSQRDPATPARPSRSLRSHTLLKANHSQVTTSFYCPVFLNICRSFFWLRNGPAWTSSRSLRSTLKSSTAKAWKSVTSSSRGKVKRTVRPSSTSCWSTSTSGHSRPPVSVWVRLFTACVCGNLWGFIHKMLIKLPFSCRGTRGVSSAKLFKGMQLVWRSKFWAPELSDPSAQGLMYTTK